MMKLSEAMRVGAKMRAASERGWNDVGPSGEMRTCALSAAAEGAGIFTFIDNCTVPGPNYIPPKGPDQFVRDENFQTSHRAAVPDEWNIILNYPKVPPCECKALHVASPVIILVWHLHDVHAWSREAVAEWIETIENEIEKKAWDAESGRLQIAKDMGIDQ